MNTHWPFQPLVPALTADWKGCLERPAHFRSSRWSFDFYPEKKKIIREGEQTPGDTKKKTFSYFSKIQGLKHQGNKRRVSVRILVRYVFVVVFCSPISAKCVGTKTLLETLVSNSNTAEFRGPWCLSSLRPCVWASNKPCVQNDRPVFVLQNWTEKRGL